MSPSLAVSLLLLSLFLSEAQGIRLEKGFISVRQQINMHKETAITKESNAGHNREVAECKDGGECSGSTRKLMTIMTSSTTTTTTTTTTSKKEKNGEDIRAHGQDGNFKAKSSAAISKHRDDEAATKQQYPDLIDMTEMDYSPARRKPPIHN